MPVTRETDSDAAAAHSAGWAAYRAGAPLAHDKGSDWTGGWLAAAAAARRDLAAGAGLIEKRETILDAMQTAYAAIRRIEGVSKLRPGDRSQLHSAAVKLGAALPYVEGSDRPRPRRA